MDLLDLKLCGWKVVDNKLECDWESEDNMKSVRDRVGLLFKGCSCSSVNACTNRRCGCVKNGSNCGPGCRCKNCGNLPATDSLAPSSSDTVVVEDELIELEEEELQQNDELRLQYREVYADGESNEGKVLDDGVDEGSPELVDADAYLEQWDDV